MGDDVNVSECLFGFVYSNRESIVAPATHICTLTDIEGSG